MPDPKLEKLLILQDRDIRRRGLEQQIAAIPKEILSLEEKIAAEKARLEASKGKLRELEVSRKEVDGSIAEAEQQIARYKNQQLQVKKNEEYKALTHEIDLVQGKINELEERGISLLIELDEEKSRMESIETDFRGIIGPLEERIADHRAREISLKAELETARAEVDAARADTAPEALAVYDRQAGLARMPIVVALREKTCQGCHLRVSGEVEDDVRRNVKIATCDCCGRILYWER